MSAFPLTFHDITTWKFVLSIVYFSLAESPEGIVFELTTNQIIKGTIMF